MRQRHPAAPGPNFDKFLIEGCMKRIPVILSLLAVVLFAAFALSCGASSQSQLQSITLNPATADAQSFPNGQVPFTATGIYSNPSHTVTPQSVNWAACQQSAPTNEVSISTSGVAQCGGSASGTYSINAWDIPTGSGTHNCPVINACGGGCTIEATAQLTCP